MANVMTPQEIADHKMRWKPGYTICLHSDLVDRGKTWCRSQLKQHQWSVTKWTDVYEHTFHFENEVHSQEFKKEFLKFVISNNDTLPLDPDKRDWEYDGYGVKRDKDRFQPK